MNPVTPNAPVMERSSANPSSVPPMEHPPLMTPPVWQTPAPPPYGWQAPYPPSWQQAAPHYEPSAGQRLALAIVSLALMIPLSAIAIGIATPLAEATTGWAGILVGMLAFLLVCAAVVGVNVVFNFDLLRSVRRR